VKRLSEDEIRIRLASIPEWRRDGDEMRRTFGFGSFAAAVAFVTRVAALAESADHHPDIDIRYDKVTLALSTHSAGGLTARDMDMATRIDDESRAS
jgi:4a-hydroxytetrahydrobiopterin dehydratase